MDIKQLFKLKKTIDKSKLDPNTELGAALLKLDSVYEEIENVTKHIKFLEKNRTQLEEDAELMEYLLMHKANKTERFKK